MKQQTKNLKPTTEQKATSMQGQWWKGFLTTGTGVDIQCQFETLHPDTVFQIQGLETVLLDEERKQEIEEMRNMVRE